MNNQHSELGKLALDVYNGKVVSFNEVTGDEAIRNMISEVLDIEKGGKIDYYKWEANKLQVFQILSVALDAALPVTLSNHFDALADVRNVALGDINKFEIQDNSLLRVGLVAAGTQDLQRQQLFGKSFSVHTDWYGTRVYAEFERFMSGKVDWKALVDRVAASFINKMQEQIYTAFSKSYDSLRATRKETGAYDEEKLLDLASHVEIASGGKEVAIYGTRKALRKVSKDVDKSDDMKNKVSEVGHVGRVSGIDLVALPQAYKRGRDEFAIDDNTLLILPKGEKIVAIVLEGDAIVNDTDALARTDLQQEFVTLKKYGVQVAQVAKYGIYKISK